MFVNFELIVKSNQLKFAIFRMIKMKLKILDRKLKCDFELTERDVENRLTLISNASIDKFNYDFVTFLNNFSFVVMLSPIRK